MSTFLIQYPQTIIFATPPSGELTIYNGRKVYHIQKTTNGQTAVKFPDPGKYTANAEILSKSTGISKPSALIMGKADRNYKANSFHVVYNANLKDTPARIFYEIGRCEVGPAFLSLPLQWQKFILFHEKAHLFYSDEFNADKYALNYFMQKGYNFSQAKYALESVLKKSEENTNRIKTLLNIIKNAN